MTRTGFMLACLGIVLVSFSGTRAVDLPEKTVTERIEAIEKVLIRDPAQPRTTVLARLDAIEATLKEMAKAGGNGAKAEARQDQQLKRDLEALDKKLADLEKRVRTETGKGDGSGDIRDVKKSVEQLGRTLDDLKDRVKRLESKR